MDAKAIRKQIRNVFQAEAANLLSNELKETLTKQLNDEQNRRLDVIEQYCQSALAKADSRSKAIEGFLMKVVKVEIQNDLYNANITLDAMVEVLAEAGLGIDQFTVKLDNKKKELDARKKEAAAAHMKAQMEARADVPAVGATVDAPPAAQTPAPAEETKAE